MKKSSTYALPGNRESSKQDSFLLCICGFYPNAVCAKMAFEASRCSFATFRRLNWWRITPPTQNAPFQELNGGLETFPFHHFVHSFPFTAKLQKSCQRENKGNQWKPSTSMC